MVSNLDFPIVPAELDAFIVDELRVVLFVRCTELLCTAAGES